MDLLAEWWPAPEWPRESWFARRLPAAQCLGRSFRRRPAWTALTGFDAGDPERADRTGFAGAFPGVAGSSGDCLDVAHNPQAVGVLADNLGDMAFSSRTIAVVGMLADKDIAGSLAPLAGKVDTWLLADLDVPRGASAVVLAAAVSSAGLGGRVECFASPRQAFARSAELAEENGRIIVFGSFYTVAAVMHSMQHGR